MSDQVSEFTDDEYYTWRAEQDRFLAGQLALFDPDVIEKLYEQFKKPGDGEIKLEGAERAVAGNCIMYVTISAQLRDLAEIRRKSKERGKDGV